MESKYISMLCAILGLIAAAIVCADNLELRQERDQLKQLLNQKQPPVNCPSTEWFNGRRGEA